MNAILASKLYRTSPRKEAIRAAMENPVNRELLVQVSDMIDDDVKEAVKQQAREAAEAAKPVEPRVVLKVSDINRTADDPEVQEPSLDVQPKEAVTSPAEEPIEEVESAEEVTAAVEPSVPSLDTVQGELNAKDDTAGVVRTKVNDDELWIYFNDKKNLNNLMGAVLDSLAACGYTQLEFNRLARTENAIVFQITQMSEVNNGQEA